MTLWRLIKRLVFTQSTLARALGEIELLRLIDAVIPGGRVSAALVAGGGKHSSSSESVLIEALESSAKLIRVDLEQGKRPDLRADLTVVWPFRQETFDLIVSTWVVEHLAKPEAFFREAFRVLKYGGALVCSVPFIYRVHGSPSDYWRFTDTALSFMTRLVGFRTVNIRSVGGSPCMTCLSLVWPFLRIRFIAILLVILAYGSDSIIRWICQVTGKGHELVTSYPIHFIVYARKE